MKYFSYLVLILLALLSACKVDTTNPNNGNDANLTLINNFNETIFYQIADGSMDEDVVYTIPPQSSVTLSWDINDNVFETQYGEIIITYYTENGTGGVIFYVLRLGSSSTIYLENVSHELVLRNETNGDLVVTYIDGYEAPFSINSESLIGFDYNIIVDTNIYLEYTGDHVFSNYDTITLTPDYETDYSINADAGAFKIQNNNPINDISEVYISPSSESFWGPNLLAYDITPGGWALWTVEEGLWDIKIVDQWGSYFEIFGQFVNLDTTTDITYRTGYKNSMEPSKSDKIKGEASFFNKIEFKRSSVSHN